MVTACCKRNHVFTRCWSLPVTVSNLRSVLYKGSNFVRVASSLANMSVETNVCAYAVPMQTATDGSALDTGGAWSTPDSEVQRGLSRSFLRAGPKSDSSASEFEKMCRENERQIWDRCFGGEHHPEDAGSRSQLLPSEASGTRTPLNLELRLRRLIDDEEQCDPSRSGSTDRAKVPGVLASMEGLGAVGELSRNTKGLSVQGSSAADNLFGNIGSCSNPAAMGESRFSLFGDSDTSIFQSEDRLRVGGFSAWRPIGSALDCVRRIADFRPGQASMNGARGDQPPAIPLFPIQETGPCFPSGEARASVQESVRPQGSNGFFAVDSSPQSLASNQCNACLC